MVFSCRRAFNGVPPRWQLKPRSSQYEHVLEPLCVWHLRLRDLGADQQASKVVRNILPAGRTGN